MVLERVGDGLNDASCKKKLPTDWAYSKREVLVQVADLENQVLENNPVLFSLSFFSNCICI